MKFFRTSWHYRPLLSGTLPGNKPTTTRPLSEQASPPSLLKHTALHDFHLKHNGKMVPFAGYSMPVQYNGDLSIIDSHLHTRSQASLFDVSHMLKMVVKGKDRVDFLESLVVADLQGLAQAGATLTLYTNKRGGIIDDLIVAKQEDHLYIVSNAARAQEDWAHLTKKLSIYLAENPKAEVEFEVLDKHSLLALQGPQSQQVLQGFVGELELSKVKFMQSLPGEFGPSKVPIQVTRCGYTGEDGFELLVPDDDAPKVAQALLDCQQAQVKLAGLGARDSLR